MITPLKVRFYGDECLRQPAEKVSSVGPAERMLIDSMIVTMKKEKGIGLAAPQVGINKQIIVVDIDDGHGPLALINPEIVKFSAKCDKMEEGCLSIPNVNIVIERPKKITVHFVNDDNEAMEGQFEGLMARVIQHEVDHLLGKLIVDYASDQDLEKYKDKLIELEQKAS